MLGCLQEIDTVMVGMSILWGIFALIFGYLAFRHWRMSQQVVKSFQLNPEKEPRAAKIMGIPTTQKDMTEFVRHFNAYIDKYNMNSKKQNQLAATGYFAAALTSIVSMALCILNQ